MLFEIRRKDGSIDPFSAGTFVDTQGKSHHLAHTDFTLTPLSDSWKSPVTSATYPVRWRISVPKLGIELEADTALKSQELTGQSKWIPNYWEGAISLSGHKEHSPLKGAGYLEMTGYDRAVEFAQ
jgi:predicted secreted hydrolase